MDHDMREVVAHINNMITELEQIKSCYGPTIHDSKKEALRLLGILAREFTYLAGREAVNVWISRPRAGLK